MALTKKQRAWVARSSRILDDMEKWDPDDPRLAPFKTKNWIDKGKGMLRGLKPIAVVVLLALGGCTEGWLESFASAAGDHSTTFVGGRAITTYHYPQQKCNRKAPSLDQMPGRKIFYIFQGCG